ncbi:MAG: YqcI/YcgG family protein [Chitinophagaceae bacterium]|nr:YqcI/YcgG family protein [Chitinophagaceae bacterium]
MIRNDELVNDYKTFIGNKNFSCVAAKAALAKQQLHAMVADHMACPVSDKSILEFLYAFVDEYRKSENLYHSAAIIFKQPQNISEAMFEEFLWQRLQALSDLDAQQFGFDKRVQSDPSSADFSFSLKEEAFFIIGLHPNNSRQTRQFKNPAIVFNPHQQFEQLRQTDKYRHLQHVVRKRDVELSGSINPMLHDFGEESEVYQYSGRKYGKEWQCPLKISHERA